MVDAVVSGVVELLGTILVQQVEQEVKLVAGVEEQIRSLTRKFVVIRAVLDDAEKRQVNESSVRLWLDELKDASYDVEDLLNEWRTAILKSTIIQKKEEKEEATDRICCVTSSLKVCSFFPSNCFGFNRLVLRHDIAHKIKQLNVRLDAIESERRTYKFVEGRGGVEPERQITASVVDVLEVHGRDKDKSKLLKMLLSESRKEVSGLCIISIVGMGGLGKTTLARLVYNEDLVEAHFEKRAWVCVSDPFDEKRVARSILEALTGVAPNVNELQTLLHLMSNSLTKKKFFLVLDDVWTEDYRKWEQLRDTLKCCSPESRVLVTTRKDTVASMLGIKHLLKPGLLSEEACWSLFSQVAFFGRSNEERENLEDLGRDIVKKCNGLPLAAKVIGSLLRFKERREEWEYVLHSKIWELELETSQLIIAPLLLSYYDLSSSVRRCFSYCGLFPKDYRIEKDELIYMWMAQGLLSSTRNIKMEEVGEEYVNVLVTRSFFQYFSTDSKDNSVYCTMHDLVHDLAQYLTMGECFLVESHGGDQEASKINHFGSKARHLTVLLEGDTQFPNLVDVGKKLHTLKISASKSYSMEDEVLSRLFDQLTYLRTLDVSVQSVSGGQNCIQKLPKDLEKLVHLRYLNLSGNKMLKELPESLCDLWNLQTLNINHCISLKRLPRGMGKLVNLRHLENERTYRLSFLPKELKQLTSLLTIKEFVVSVDGNGDEAMSLRDLKSLKSLRGSLKIIIVSENDDDSEAMTRGNLKSVKSLRGSLTIFGLGKLTDVEGAKQAICHMKHIEELELDFWGKRAQSVMDAVVLEALQPPPQLQELRIRNYGGPTMFPSWLKSLTKLTSLVIDNFENLEHLPSLGKLPSLERLEIRRMDKVKTMDFGFMEASSDCSTETEFPKLKRLEFQDMRNWREWKDTTRTEEHSGSITRRKITMPQLRHLTVCECYKLLALPDYFFQTPNQVELNISSCPFLEHLHDWRQN